MITIFISPKNESRPYILTAHSKIDDSFVATMVTSEDLDNIANNLVYCDLKDGKFFFDKAKFDDFILNKHKDELLKEIQNFFKVDGRSRLITIQNCHPQPIFCDQNFINNLNSAKDQAIALGRYEHKITDVNNLGILDETTTTLIGVAIKLEALEQIKIIVELRRGYCYKAELWHRTKINLINSLQQIDEYKNKYSSVENEGISWSGSDGQKYIPPSVIKIKEGIIVNKEEFFNEAS
jgi:hypothetical protein